MINGKILTSLKDFQQKKIKNIHVISGYGTVVEREVAVVISTNLYKACMRCTGVIMFNGTIIPKEGISEPIFN